MIALTTDDLNTIFRNEVHDVLTPGASPTDVDKLWKETEIYCYMSEAVDAVANKTDELYKIILLPVISGSNLVPLSHTVLNIRNARTLSNDFTLVQKNLDSPHDYWSPYYTDYGSRIFNEMFQTTGFPREYVRDYQRSALWLMPQPVANDTLELQASVTLSVPLQAGMLLPIKNTQAQRCVLHYMKYLAYMKQNAETLDLQRSLQFKQLYDAEVKDRDVTLAKQRRAPGVVQFNW